MTKSFTNRVIDFDFIGFDIDGTIYDELSFVSQAYNDVALYLSNIYKIEQKELYEQLISYWKQNGSSYPVFQDVMKNEHGIEIDANTIKGCIQLYRNCSFKIKPFPEVVNFIKRLYGKKRLFIVSDGNKDLQLNKFQSLGLNKWFDMKDVYISGMFGKQYQKPSIRVLEFLRNSIGNSTNVLFIGDRKVDEEFAANAGFSFIYAKELLNNGR